MLNKTIVQGRLCADPEIRETTTGVQVCSFRIAWSKEYNGKKTVLFLPCSAWRGTGDLVAKHFQKGKEIIVEGEISTHEWNGDDGGKRSAIELTVDKVHFCGARDSSMQSTSTTMNAPLYGDQNGFTEVPDEELPF